MELEELAEAYGECVQWAEQWEGHDPAEAPEPVWVDAYEF